MARKPNGNVDRLAATRDANTLCSVSHGTRRTQSQYIPRSSSGGNTNVTPQMVPASMNQTHGEGRNRRYTPRVSH